MPRLAGLLFIVAALACSFVLTSCGESAGGIYVQPLASSTARLTPHPDHIYLAPFDMSTARYEVGREGTKLVEFKADYQEYFLHKLQNELNNMAPTESRWQDDLPDHGWLIGGEFITIDQGSRALRTVVGTGEGETTLEANIYVYDLSISKTQYVYSLRIGGGSGELPAGFATAGEPVTTAIGLGSGLKLDARHAVEQIHAVLKRYY